MATPLKLGGGPSGEVTLISLEDRLREIARADPLLKSALEDARQAALPEWWIVSGAIYNTVWNVLTGRPSGHGIKDIDLFYFDDTDLSYEAEDKVIRSCRNRFAPTPPVEIRNQARVHLWYEAHFGRAIAPLTSCRHSIENFAAETHAVGMRLNCQDEIEICAPYGLGHIFDLQMVPNPRNDNRATYEAKSERIAALWPEVTILAWPEKASR